MRVTVEDALGVGFCTRGQREFFATHDLDFRRFVREGFTLEDFGGIEDVFITMAFDAAKARLEKTDGR